MYLIIFLKKLLWGGGGVMLSTKECHGFNRISSVTLIQTAVIYTVGFIMIKEEFLYDIFENTLRNKSIV